MYNTLFYKTLLKMAQIDYQKHYYDNKTEKGNYEYAVRSFCRYLKEKGYNLDTRIIYRITDTLLKEYLVAKINEANGDIKKSVLVGKTANILNRVLVKSVKVIDLWPSRDVECECGTYCILIDSLSAYGYDRNGRTDGPKYYYRCPICGAMVGCHGGTNIPMGTPAPNSNTAKMRVNVHKMIDQLISNNDIERTDIYEYLSKKMNHLDKEMVHVGYFNVLECEEAIRHLENYTPLTAAG